MDLFHHKATENQHMRCCFVLYMFVLCVGSCYVLLCEIVLKVVNILSLSKQESHLGFCADETFLSLIRFITLNKFVIKYMQYII